MTKDARLTTPDTLEIVRVLSGPLQRVWDHLVESDLRARWLCAGDFEPRVGGKIVLDFDHRRLSKSPPPARHADQQQIRFEGTVTVYEPPTKLAFLWPEANGAPSEVTISLRERGECVELRLLHARLARTDHRTQAAAGWHAHLDLLGDVLDGRAARDFWLAHEPLVEHYRGVLED